MVLGRDDVTDEDYKITSFVRREYEERKVDVPVLWEKKREWETDLVFMNVDLEGAGVDYKLGPAKVKLWEAEQKMWVSEGKEEKDFTSEMQGAPAFRKGVVSDKQKEDGLLSIVKKIWPSMAVRPIKWFDHGYTVNLLCSTDCAAWDVEGAIRAATFELVKEGVFTVQLENPRESRKLWKKREEAVKMIRAKRALEKIEKGVVMEVKDDRTEIQKKEDKVKILQLEAKAMSYRKPGKRVRKGGKKGNWEAA
jgi:hypothetical protein